MSDRPRRPALEGIRTIRSADVWKGSRLAATLTRTDAGVVFAYTADYLAQPGPTVATTLPLKDVPTLTPAGALPAYFAGLLPAARGSAGLATDYLRASARLRSTRCVIRTARSRCCSTCVAGSARPPPWPRSPACSMPGSPFATHGPPPATPDPRRSAQPGRGRRMPIAAATSDQQLPRRPSRGHGHTRPQASRRIARGSCARQAPPASAPGGRVFRASAPGGRVIRASAPGGRVIRASAPGGRVVRASAPGGRVVRASAPVSWHMGLDSAP